MIRWFWKRSVFAAVCGTTLLVGLAAAQKSNAPQGPPKVGEVITLPFPNGVERQVKVLTSEKQPDGSYLSEVKDTKTGETFTLLDKPSDFVPQSPKPEATKPTTTKSNARPGAPLLPRPNMPAEQPKEKERKFLGSMSIFAPKSPSPAESPPPEPERPGLLKRIFGKKSTPSTSAKPGASVPAAAGGPAMPPPIRPTPGAARNNGGGMNPPLVPGTTAEPPRSRPGERLSPPMPVIPAPMGIPSAPPAGSPAPLPLPSTPGIPTVPALPPATTVPAPSGLPNIPVPPGGLSSARPGIVQAGYALPAMKSEMMQDLRESATALRTAAAPSKRAHAARALAGGRHGSTDMVKAMLFGTAQDDPSAMVRAVCIEELCKLGYRDAAYMAFLKKACDDPHPDVSGTAKDALARLAPKK